MDYITPNRVWAEVNLDNIAYNYKQFCLLTNTRVMCVIKADGYGHGAVALAKRLQNEGCDAFGVATIDEAIELRTAGINTFILLLNHVSENRIEQVLKYNLTPTVYSISMADALNNQSQNQNKITKIHIKFDTGMTRVGFSTHEAKNALNYIKSLKNLEIEGIFTHFSSADEVDTTYTNAQIKKIRAIFDCAKELKIDVKIKHSAGSSASIMYPDSRLDMVRVGISLYGCYPSEEVDKTRIDLKPAMQLKTQIFRIFSVEKGTSVSYGRLFTTNQKTTLATLPIGYADGLSRVMAQKLYVLINGQLAPIVGKICMDQCVADITNIKGEVNVFDEVVIYGQQKNAFQSVEQVANYMGTINYEILCMTARRVPRYYYENNKISYMKNFLKGE